MDECRLYPQYSVLDFYILYTMYISLSHLHPNNSLNYLYIMVNSLAIFNKIFNYGFFLSAFLVVPSGGIVIIVSTGSYTDSKESVCVTQFTICNGSIRIHC